MANSFATPDDLCVRLGIDVPADTRRLEAALADASDEIRSVIGRDVFDPVPSELTRWTCILAASALKGADATGALGMVAGQSQHTQTVDGYTEGWANYSGAKVPGLSLPPDIAARLRVTYGNYSPVVEHAPGRFG